MVVRSSRIGICPVMSSSCPSASCEISVFTNSHAVSRFGQAEYRPMFLASENVAIWSAGLPSGVGTGRIPISMSSPYTASAQGPTIAIAATSSANESPL